MDGMKWCQDTALPTTFSEPHAKRACLFASVLSILVQPTLSMMMDGWMAFDMVTVDRATISPRNTAAAAQFDEGMQCIPQVGRTTCVGGMCGDGLRNQQQADVARGPEVPWWAQWPGRTMGGTMTTTLGRWAP